MNIIQSIVTTNKGWLIRQCLKYSAIAGTWITAQLSNFGLELDNPAAIGAAAATIGTALLELGLSKLASQVAAK